MDLRLIAPTAKEIAVGDNTLSVRGISLRNCAALLSRFPAILTYLSGKGIDANELMTAIPEASAAIMAAGLGHPGDKEAEAALDALSLGDQVMLLTEVLDMTFKGDKTVPFVQAVVATAARTLATENTPSADETTELQDTTQDSPSS